MSKYAPLQHHLTQQQVREAPLSFQDVERILGFELPRSARLHPAWWANNVQTHVNARAWRNAGWKTSRVDLASERVVFVRDDSDADVPAMRSRQDWINVPLSLLNEAATRLLKTTNDPAKLVAEVLNDAATTRRRDLVERFASLSPKLSGDSAAMIRADRDAH